MKIPAASLPGWLAFEVEKSILEHTDARDVRVTVVLLIDGAMMLGAHGLTEAEIVALLHKAADLVDKGATIPPDRTVQ